MFKLVLTSLALISLNAFACPDLTGSYTCKVGDKIAIAKVSQNVVNGVTNYNVSDDTYTADGESKQLPDSQALKSATVKESCTGDTALNREIVGKFWSENVYYGDITLTSVITKTATGFTQSIVRTIKNHGGTFPLHVEEDCLKDSDANPAAP